MLVTPFFFFAFTALWIFFLSFCIYTMFDSTLQEVAFRSRWNEYLDYGMFFRLVRRHRAEKYARRWATDTSGHDAMSCGRAAI